ncbi:E2 ligase fold family C protein [Geodermatophilus sp. DSM 44513]|uniref:E2 ligase fold family C protein n=1 Tax=Geodermatophilus sp. DSM 44513 TaxID=1528104 RepID=UPI001281AEF1|nr:E2 ligase fold family C protein [Geodermatophilus sp. DSM 44513]WNV75157.1 E2 ligase fold family C protein [Geodermatophilus sp. DSM 44513]
MALAPYYDKAAIAAAQVIAGFDPSTFQRSLEGTSVGLSFADQAATSREGGALLDLTVRLLARLYPTLALRPSGPAASKLAEELSALARAINPQLDLADEADVGVAVGIDATPWTQTIYAGSDAWQGRVSVTGPCPVGDTPIPFGAGAAACLAASAIFRLLLDPTGPTPSDGQLSCLDGAAPILEADLADEEWCLPSRTVLVGAGAIGQAATWALARSPLTGTVHIADHEPIDVGNLQRYVLSTTADIGKPKATFAAEHINAAAAEDTNRLSAIPHDTDWVGARADAGTEWEAALAAVDSAAARRAVQASLPRWAANAWTQPGDLGTSDHNFLRGACIACLYLPAGRSRNEDELVAEALGVPDLVHEIRTLLYQGTPPPPDLLATIAARLGVDLETVKQFDPRSIRDLYVRGICGGAVLPLRSGAVHAEVHVPLAHQSALAGILIAARLARRAAGIVLPGTEVTRLDVRSHPPARPTQPAAKDPRGLCLCQDKDYVSAFSQQWSSAD